VLRLRNLADFAMSEPTLRPDSLVIYKQRPARVTNLNDKKVDIQVDHGETVSVRPKDVLLIHPGPMRTLNELKPQKGDITSAWELLAGDTTTLRDLAELAFDAYTPATAWAAYQLLLDGLYFSGDPHEIVVHSPEKVETIQNAREAKLAEERAWQAFLVRMQAGQYQPSDERYLADVVALALEQREQSRVLRALGREETPQNAHALLLASGYWAPTVNPYPVRQRLPITTPNLPLPPLPPENRRDLTHLTAYAIDDEEASDPDDAVSWDEGRLWVHVADVAALVPPDSPADLEARSRGANLYLPEGTVPMLPPAATDVLGLGLAEVSPALSFGIEFDAELALVHIEIVPSWVRVVRLSYDEVEDRLAEPPFATLDSMARILAARRVANGAVEINLPETKLRVVNGQVVIRPLPPLRSRDLVREAMLMTGVAVAQYAGQHNLPLPYSVQEGPDEQFDLSDGALSAMFAQRRYLRPSQPRTTPAPHRGLGLDQYVQATSPLRRYADLLVHQQLRAHLRGEQPLETAAVMARLAEASTGMITVRRTERISNTHWRLVYLLQHPGWEGEGVVVEKIGSRNIVLIPELELETEIYGRPDLTPDAVVDLQLTEVNLPLLEARFRVLK
jgi:exoribonuclease II